MGPRSAIAALFAVALIAATAAALPIGPARSQGAYHAQGLGLGLDLEAARQVEKAVELVTLFIAEHIRSYRLDHGALLNDAAAARLYLDDRLAVDGLQERLGFDPVYGGRDSFLMALAIFPDPDMPILQRESQVRVEMTHYGLSERFVYSLVRVDSGDWQIVDIYAVDGDWSLSVLMHERQIPFATTGEQEITLFSAP